MDKKVKLLALLLALLVMFLSLSGCNPANQQSVPPTILTSKPTTVTATPSPSNMPSSATTTETEPLDPDATPDVPIVTVRLTSYSPPPAPGQKSLEPFDSALTPLRIGTAATEDKDFIYYNLDNVIHRFNKATKDDVPIRASTGTIQELFMFHDDLFYVVQDFAYTSDGIPIEDDQGGNKTTNTLYTYMDQNTDEIVLKDIDYIYRVDNQYIYYDTGSDLCIFDLMYNKLAYIKNGNLGPNEYFGSWYSLDSYSIVEYLSQKIKVTDCINGKRMKSYSFPYSGISAGDGLNIVDFLEIKNGTVFKIMNTQSKTTKSFSVARKVANIQYAYIHGKTLFFISVDNDNYTSVLYGIDLDRKKIIYMKKIDGLISATVAQDGVWYYYKEVLEDDVPTDYICRFNTNNMTHAVLNPHEEIGNSVNFLELCGGYIFGFEENWIDVENYRFQFMLPIK